MHFEVPVKKCSKGHVIPLNGDVVGYERDSLGIEHPVRLKAPRLICEQCAIEVGGITSRRLPRLKNGKRDKDQACFLDTTPAIFIS